MMCEFLPLHDVGEELPIVNQYLWTPLDQFFQFFAFVGHAAHDAVDHDEGGSGNHSARDGVVSAVHGVLHGVTQDQKQNQVKGCQLAHLSFPCHTQDDEQKHVNDKA